MSLRNYSLLLSPQCSTLHPLHPLSPLQSHGIIQDPRPQFPGELDAGMHELGVAAFLAMSCFPVGQLTVFAALPRASACATHATTGAVLEAPYTEAVDHWYLETSANTNA